MRTLENHINHMLKNEDFKKEYCVPDCFELKQIRKSKHITQKQLGKIVNMKQESISRMENNSDSTTLKQVGKIAYALGYKARLTFKKLEMKDEK